MADHYEITESILRKLKEKLSGKNLGMTCGFENIDNQVSRIQHGQLWTVGGYTGVGKSYFILNMIDGMLLEKESLKIAVFSTELSSEDYLLRYACMRVGIYKIQLQKNPYIHTEKVKEELMLILKEREDNPNSLDIYGDVSDYSDVEKVLKGHDYDVAFVDYVQELSINGKYDVKDTMPMLGKKLKNLALTTKTAIIAVSQVNNYAMKEDQSKSQVQPFSFGKELVQASSVAIYLERKKANGVLDYVSVVNVTKARDGQIGRSCFQIDSGYRLMPFKTEDSIDYLQKFDSKK
jgi:replicative DNA helicase